MPFERPSTLQLFVERLIIVEPEYDNNRFERDETQPLLDIIHRRPALKYLTTRRASV